MYYFLLADPAVTFKDYLIGPIAAIVGAISTAVFTWIFNKRGKKRRDKATEAISNVADVYDLLSHYGLKMRASSALIFYTSNGGGIPDVGKEIKSTILYEVVMKENSIPTKLTFQQIHVDKAYANFLRSLIKEGYWDSKTEDMEEGFMKDTSITNGIVYKHVQELKRGERRYYYIVLRWNDVNDIPKPEVIRSYSFDLKNQLSPLFKRTKD